MECEEKARLVAEHHVAALAFSQAVRALTGRMKTSNVAEHERLGTVKEETRVKSIEARTALERHRREHGC
jgi:hypothetical protein